MKLNGIKCFVFSRRWSVWQIGSEVHVSIRKTQGQKCPLVLTRGFRAVESRWSFLLARVGKLSGVYLRGVSSVQRTV